MVRRILARLRTGWRALRAGDRLDADLAREIDAHLQDLADEHVARGMSPADARRAAHQAFGSRAAAEEGSRDARGIAVLEHLARDLRYGWRGLVRQPMLLVAATASIALGVAANLSVYAVANDLLLSVPSAARPDELVHVRTGNGSHVSYAAWTSLEASGAVAGLAGYRIDEQVNWRDGETTVPVTPLVVTPNYFEVVGVPVAAGRGFTPADVARDPRVAVVTDAFRRRSLAGAADVVGRTVTLNGDPYTIIGVLPAGVRSLPGYGIAPDLYLPASRSLLPAIDRPLVPVVQLVGRLRAGQTPDQARDALAAAAARFGESAGDREIGAFVAVARMGGVDQVRDFAAVGAFFLVLLVVATLVLLIACANVAGLLLARSVARRREIALRLALGSSRRRLLQQLLTESLLLAVVGTVAGLALTWLAGRVLASLTLPLPVPIHLAPAFDLRLLAAAGGLVLVTTVFCGLVPALQATRPRLLPAIHQPDAPAAHRRLTMRRLLVAGQVTVSVLLLAVALLFLRNLLRSTTIDPGFDVDRLVVARMTFVEGRQGSPGTRTISRVVGRVRAVPGVTDATFAEGVPLTLMSGSWNGTDLRLGEDAEPTHLEFARNAVGPDYFRTMGIPVRGRGFTEADRTGAPRVVVVNEEFARRYFGDRDAIGSTLVDPRDADPAPRRIVGVAANSKYQLIGEPQRPAMYEPALQSRDVERLMHVIVRAPGATGATLAAIRDAMLAEDASAAVTVEPMRQALAFAFLPSRIGAALLGTLGVLGTTLAMVGLYGILSFSVGRRTKEIGLRMSLGASRGSVIRLVLSEASVLVAAGVVLGLGLALLVTQPLATFLVAGLSPADPATLAGTIALLAAVSLIAAWSPVRRATRIDPTRALRHE
ncbi:MAG: ADOP family duplicated permease [Vicinamibacterales bacterium]